MTRIFYDCEFLEDGKTIELISIGLISDVGDEYYAINRDFRWDRIASRNWLTRRWTTHQPWLVDNVVRSLPQYHGDARLHMDRGGPMGVVNFHDRRFEPRSIIADEVRQFIASHPDVELWADYGAYDHVVLCQLWGRMIDLPDGVPMFTHDFQQELDRLGRPDLPALPATEHNHNALDDARHLRAQFLAVAA